MSNNRRFGTDNRHEVRALHAQYMADNLSIEDLAQKHAIGHNTIRNAFHDFGLPLKIKRGINPDEVRVLQRELEAPIDYLAAKYGVHENTVRRWLKNSRYKHKKFQGTPAKHWWRAMGASCGDDPNEFYTMMRAEPHGLAPTEIVRIYHRRFKPKEPIFWMLTIPLPAEVIDEDDMADYAASTQLDDSPSPTMFLGVGTVVNPIRWANEIEELDSEYTKTNAEESDADLASVAEELGMTLEELAKQQR